jgi:hypothetical protein
VVAHLRLDLPTRRGPLELAQTGEVFHALMSTPELDHLIRLIGETIEEVRSDGWAVNLLTELGPTTFIPEEVATPLPTFETADVERLRVASEPMELVPRERLGKLGRIEAVDVLTTVILFTVRSTGLTTQYHVPGSPEALSGDAEVDLGIVLRQADGRELFVSTSGFFAEFAVGGLKGNQERLQQCKRTTVTSLRMARS